MSEHFNSLTPAEAERLAILAEECGEIVQIVMKALRHGLDFHHPDSGETNRAAICRELGDLDAICRRMSDLGEIDPALIQEASERKTVKLRQWTHHQPDSAFGNSSTQSN
jgi:NTP pyrophosphatase (non-canonical NTP hydrolase)